MNSLHLSMALHAILVGLLLYACVTDWRERIIPHWVNITIALLAPLVWWTYGLHLWPDVALQIGLALATFIVFLIFQIMGAMGGGDVKLLAALALWFHWIRLLQILILTSVLGGVLTLGLLIVHKARKSEEKLEIPYGIAIAAAGIFIICEHYFNHFR